MRGNLGRLAILALLLVSGCATKPAASSYRIQIPTLALEPKLHACWARDGSGIRRRTDCATLLADDYFAIVHELKAACLANGQEPEQCQAIVPAEP